MPNIGFARLRRQLGLTQRQLAQFIGKDHSQVYRFESGIGLIGASAAPGLSQLWQAMLAGDKAGPTNPPPLPAESTAKTYNQWSRHALRCIKRQRQLQKGLARLRAQASQCAALLQCLDLLEAQGSLTEHQQRWADSRRYEAQIRLQQCHPGMLAEMQFRLHLLQQEVEWYEAAAAGNVTSVPA